MMCMMNANEVMTNKPNFLGLGSTIFNTKYGKNVRKIVGYPDADRSVDLDINYARNIRFTNNLIAVISIKRVNYLVGYDAELQDLRMLGEQFPFNLRDGFLFSADYPYPVSPTTRYVFSMNMVTRFEDYIVGKNVGKNANLTIVQSIDYANKFNSTRIDELKTIYSVHLVAITHFDAGERTEVTFFSPTYSFSVTLNETDYFQRLITNETLSLERATDLENSTALFQCYVEFRRRLFAGEIVARDLVYDEMNGTYTDVDTSIKMLILFIILNLVCLLAIVMVTIFRSRRGFSIRQSLLSYSNRPFASIFRPQSSIETDKKMSSKPSSTVVTVDRNSMIAKDSSTELNVSSDKVSKMKTTVPKASKFDEKSIGKSTKKSKVVRSSKKKRVD